MNDKAMEDQYDLQFDQNELNSRAEPGVLQTVSGTQPTAQEEHLEQIISTPTHQGYQGLQQRFRSSSSHQIPLSQQYETPTHFSNMAPNNFEMASAQSNFERAHVQTWNPSHSPVSYSPHSNNPATPGPRHNSFSVQPAIEQSEVSNRAAIASHKQQSAYSVNFVAPTQPQWLPLFSQIIGPTEGRAQHGMATGPYHSLQPHQTPQYYQQNQGSRRPQPHAQQRQFMGYQSPFGFSSEFAQSTPLPPREQRQSFPNQSPNQRSAGFAQSPTKPNFVASPHLPLHHRSAQSPRTTPTPPRELVEEMPADWRKRLHTNAQSPRTPQNASSLRVAAAVEKRQTYQPGAYDVSPRSRDVPDPRESNVHMLKNTSPGAMSVSPASLETLQSLTPKARLTPDVYRAGQSGKASDLYIASLRRKATSPSPAVNGPASKRQRQDFNVESTLHTSHVAVVRRQGVQFPVAVSQMPLHAPAPARLNQAQIDRVTNQHQAEELSRKFSKSEMANAKSFLCEGSDPVEAQMLRRKVSDQTFDKCTEILLLQSLGHIDDEGRALL
ncbi:hypothetical protein EJ08DRAFT_681988 [Tothia fuscella]|uniref:Uncharacterized protein n=1 Tax=Tothia fuscella TaxID=1048955 RepID=A0A9P4TUU4_9PEZI|nr:hypothetical protein EJ08DRAFT_681988 [Tothia fuscella]